MSFPSLTRVPSLSTSQMIEVDRAMIEDYGITLIQMMENAGRGLANLARHRFLDGDPRGRHVVVLAGTGGNGGGALVAARQLHNYGAHVTAITTKPAAMFKGVPAHQLTIVQKLGLHRVNSPPTATLHSVKNPPAAVDLIIDGLIGYSLQGAPRGVAAELIRWANGHNRPVLALDAPSGVDTGSGTVYDPAIQATATLTLALPKTGLLAPAAAAYVGELFLADIGVPPELYAAPTLGLDVGAVFAHSDIVRVTSDEIRNTKYE